ncbi:ribonuclease H1 [Rhexocercosporidium sp. MPI-PUGE-AT-0058]|nr:ribonuclease H1 [Rhexocercosporidium sp. MPI-PUGE-AT-0058]
MVYTMEIYIDGGCRGNGHPDAFGAAAAVFKYRYGRQTVWTRYLESTDDYWNEDPPVTNQRAEITAVIIALEQALEKFQDLRGNPWLDVKIYTDSKYVFGCMTEWIYKWSNNGWINAAGNPVANQDLIRQASDLDDRLKEEGSVQYLWIPRAENQDADEACNDRMDTGY